MPGGFCVGIFCHIWRRIGDLLILKENEKMPDSLTDEELLRQAHCELQQASNLFSRVEDPDMIEYAIYNLKAAEKRYGFYLKRQKEKKALESENQ
jgi:hypothetical protein